jgi:hypothetical protein
MKTKTFILIAVLLLAGANYCNGVNIIDVNVIPQQPSTADAITFYISGVASQRPSWVDPNYDQFTQDGTSLELDLHVHVGYFTETSYWTYSKEIGTLPAETYQLTVRAFDSRYPLDDPYIYTKEFTVTPEPSTLIFFGLALPVFRIFMRRKV